MFEHKLLDQMSEVEQQGFKSDAQAIIGFEYFKWLMEDLELFAERKMYTGNPDDIKWGKGALDIIDKMHGDIKKMSISKLPIRDNKIKKLMRKFL